MPKCTACNYKHQPKGKLSSEDQNQTEVCDDHQRLTFSPLTSESAAPFSTLIILQKFLRANSASVPDAKRQLLAALKWRKVFQPLKLLGEVFDKSRFQGLGYVARLKGVPGSANETDVCAFNIYGAVKDSKKTFGDLDG